MENNITSIKDFISGENIAGTDAALELAHKFGAASSAIVFLVSEHDRLVRENEDLKSNIDFLNKQLDEGRDIPEPIRLVWENEFPEATDVQMFANGLAEALQEWHDFAIRIQEISEQVDDLEYYLDDADDNVTRIQRTASSIRETLLL